MLIKNQQHIADNNMNDNFDLYQYLIMISISQALILSMS